MDLNLANASELEKAEHGTDLRGQLGDFVLDMLKLEMLDRV